MQALRAAAGLGKSSTQVRLLGFLTDTPGQEFHTRDLVRRVGGTERPVHLALERLEKQRYVRSRRVGNLRLWSADTTHPLYKVMRDVLATTIGLGAQLGDLVGSERGVQAAFIFGSYATKTEDVASDIDLFLLTAPGTWTGIDRKLEELSRRMSRRVNPIIWTERDLANAVKNDLPILAELRRGPKIWLKGDEGEFDRRLGASVQRSAAKGRAKPKGGAEQARSRGAQRSTGPTRPRRRRS